MSRVMVGQTVWLTRAPVERSLSRARLRRGALLRGLGLAGAAALLGAVALTFLPPPEAAVAAPAPAPPAAPKAAARVAAWNGPVAPASAAAPAAAGLNAGDLFEARPFTAAPARFETGSAPARAALAFAPAPAAVRDGWREAEHPRVEAVDGRTLDAGSLRIVIAGIGLPDPGQMCRTLDGRIEPCAARARTQLELLTRSRTVSCRTRDLAPGLAEGSCRIGSSDLAERLLRTGFVHRQSDEGRTVAFMDVREP